MSKQVVEFSDKTAEKMVLGTMLTAPEPIIYPILNLEVTDLYFLDNQAIFQAIKEVFFEYGVIEILLVGKKLNQKEGELKGKKALERLIDLAQFAGTSAHVEAYCKDIREMSIKRKLFELSGKMQQEVLNNKKDVLSVFKDITDKCNALINDNSSDSGKSLEKVIEETKWLEKMKERMEYYRKHNTPYIEGLPTGFDDFDNKMSLLKNGSVIVIAARPAMGKTALALNIIHTLSIKKDIPGALFSIEMKNKDILNRLGCIQTRVSSTALSTGTMKDFEYEQFIYAKKEILKKPLWFFETNISNVNNICIEATKLVHEKKIEYIVVDYLQLMTADGDQTTRNYEVGKISTALKMLAKELNIPVLIIAQLSRKVEERSNKRPMMSDLRDSGQIEQDADAVIFIYRRDYYDDSDKPGEAELILSKNRHGPTKNITVQFDAECGKFTNRSPII